MNFNNRRLGKADIHEAMNNLNSTARENNRNGNLVSKSHSTFPDFK